MPVDLQTIRLRNLSGPHLGPPIGETWVVDDANGRIYVACTFPTRTEVMRHIRLMLRAQHGLPDSTIDTILTAAG